MSFNNPDELLGEFDETWQSEGFDSRSRAVREAIPKYIESHAELVEVETSLAGESRMAELSNGCICCGLQGELRNELFQLGHSYEFDHLVIEASGISEPKPIASQPNLDWHDEHGDREQRLALLETDLDEEKLHESGDECLVTNEEWAEELEAVDNPFPAVEGRVFTTGAETPEPYR